MNKLPFFFLMLCLCGCASPRLFHGIPNFAVVQAPAPGRAGIYRGGQPNAEGEAYLASIGVTNQVKLNTEPDPAGTADRFAVYVLPIGLLQQTVTGPDPLMVIWAADLVGLGTFVHCEHGQDRTGLVVAEYRLRCGWTREAARREMLALGYHRILFGLEWAWNARDLRARADKELAARNAWLNRGVAFPFLEYWPPR